MLNPFWHAKSTLNCGGRLVSLDTPVVMGILNVTPDSFYAGSRLDSSQAAVDRAGQMLEEGMTLVDIGGYSSRPGAPDIPIAEEMDRVIPVISAIHRAFPALPMSVDTFRAEVARDALDQGATLINDISGGQLDPAMWDLVARSKVPYILMHMPGNPSTMQSKTTYQDVAVEVLDWIIHQVGLLRKRGVHDIIIDPGFGFGKTVEQNFQLLHHLDYFRVIGLPLLVGISRKSMIWKTVRATPENALHGTTAAHLVALQKGARILRVHDVRPAVDAIRIWQATQQASQPDGQGLVEP